ncbi:YggL 50S ribosome-binding family protein [Spirosoma radiotolerans]|uniref:DUF469 domain-containing protein n=1 Tax=Spirosoma radiotolerans TaxID=1379870 RepID=A0A0E3ZUH0_9BACT|nr:YggL family protein [Spirosoma radiotolerans]AKD55539.1 hypothetical protein SD10_12145 [Spirosoma radiotolerans]
MRSGKRFRKKFHRGEFTEFGFALSFQFNPDLSTNERNSLLDAFIRDAIEANKLVFGGGGGHNQWDGFVTLDARRGSVSETQRNNVIEWLNNNPLIRQSDVSPLRDAWH